MALSGSVPQINLGVQGVTQGVITRSKMPRCFLINSFDDCQKIKIILVNSFNSREIVTYIRSMIQKYGTVADADNESKYLNLNHLKWIVPTLSCDLFMSCHRIARAAVIYRS
ncbi:hypothetical protein TNCV_554711 [Trichonephila clavipes]|nr:hypothetical protein TNCV_554711 [Trichonephila clavipes]